MYIYCTENNNPKCHYLTVGKKYELRSYNTIIADTGQEVFVNFVSGSPSFHTKSHWYTSDNPINLYNIRETKWGIPIIKCPKLWCVEHDSTRLYFRTRTQAETYVRGATG